MAVQTTAQTTQTLVEDLARVLGPERVLSQPADLLSYRYDAGFLEGLPEIVTLPGSAEEVAAVVRLAVVAGKPVVARGSGTGLCGGAVPARGGVVVALSRMNRVLRIDARNRRAVVEPGVINLDLSRAVAPYGLFYAPDPASQKISSIGGNVATNAGGPHCLAQGVTTNHILGVQAVLPDGELVWLGCDEEGRPLGTSYDLLGTVVGSEGTLAIVTKIVVRLMRAPEAVRTLLAVYPDIASGSESVSAIIGAGILPSALEMMDATICQAVERHFHAGYPEDAGSVLLIELEGAREAVEEQRERVAALCAAYGAREVRTARTEAERAALWTGRKGAAGALGQLAPSYYLQDAVVPRSRLPQIMARVGEVAQSFGLTIPNVFHAGDGNLHPAMLFDRRTPGAIERVIEAGTELLRACVEMGGTVSGEHGIGMEKRDALPLVFSAHDLAAMARLRTCFDPHELFNPDKLFPASASCVEVRDPASIPADSAPWFC
ncbi:MAG TPA: FAD-linked oxidase C-terminal domain-containing protein [Ktedonobacterales bacterium]|nr:FAD-linked oxidase C-terminal domain-containing protein [Ktedonobacterales bacterium]